MPHRSSSVLLAIALGSGFWADPARAAGSEWPVYGGDPGGTRFSPLRRINTRNVHRLRPAWVYRCDDATGRPSSTIECNPLVHGGVLYLTTPGLKVVALDAATGRQRWVFDPWLGRRGGGVNRGLARWEEGTERRLFTAAGNDLIALDPRTGNPVSSFGREGRVDLREGLDRDLLRHPVGLTTPGIVYRDLLIIGSSTGDGPTSRAPGHLRAYDVRTGERRWIFHTIPHPGEAGHETWPAEAWRTAAGCNAWGGLTLDVDRGWVFAGTGSPTYDHYGGDRPGSNLYGNSVLALDAATGALRWHFQVVHHDLWDYDLPCPPVLVTLRRDGRRIEAVAQATKTGHLFVFDRETGRPVFGVEERLVPPSELPGEAAWPTQPFPILPPAFAQQGFSLDDVTDLNPAAHRAVTERLATVRPAGLYEPPSLRASVVLPQFNGGAEWGGPAYDPETGWLFVNASNEAEWISMVPAKPTREVTLHAFGQHLFGGLCVQCHGAKGWSLSEVPTAPPARSGSPSAAPDRSRADGDAASRPPPSLDGLERRITRPEVSVLLRTGRGSMPSFAALGELEQRALIAFLYGEGHEERLGSDRIRLDWADRIRYLATGHHEWLDPEGFPVNRRPWGTLTAIDVSRGTLVWQVPLGTYPALERRGESPTGTFNIGGPIVTAGGLVFIGATRDERFRAFDRRDGRVLWEFQLDAGAYATPATFESQGRQFVVVAAGGGGKPETKPGNGYWCFALPDDD